MSQVYIGVIGQGRQPGDPPLPAHVRDAAYRTGYALARAGAVLVCGGLGGVMEAAAHGAYDAGGVAVGFLPGLDRSAANPYLTYVFPTGLGTLRNYLVIRSVHAAILIAGGVGTLQEAAIAYDHRVPVVLLRGTGGWADRLPSLLLEGKYLDERRRVAFHRATTPEEAVRLALRLAAAPHSHSTGGPNVP